MLFRIIDIDHDGFNGRENPPADDDKGKLVSPIRMESFATNAEGELVETYDASHERVTDEGREAGRYETADEHVVIRMWTCITPDGRVVELVDHEIEMFRS